MPARGRYSEAEPVLKRSLDIAQKAPGQNPQNVAALLNNLAALYVSQSRYREAEPLHKRALAVREKALGPAHPDVAVSLSNLAALYLAEGRYSEAEPLHRRALAIREKALGPDHPEVALSLANLATLYGSQKRYADAQPLYGRALAIREKALGPGHPGVAASLSNLAALYSDEGRFKDAEPLLERALAIREKVLGADHPDVAQSLDHIAEVYSGEGRYGEAEPLHRRALAIREQALDGGHPDVAQSLNGLAETYRLEDRYKDALPLVRRAAASAHARPDTAVAVLLGAQERGLLAAGQASDEALDVVQRASQTAAAAALNKLGARLAAGSDRLAQLVRSDQDLAADTEILDNAILAAVSKEPARRDPAAEQRTRERLARIAAERQDLEKVFAAEFPDYAALSNPQPLKVREIQSLLSDGEALLRSTTGRATSLPRPATAPRGSPFPWGRRPCLRRSPRSGAASTSRPCGGRLPAASRCCSTSPWRARFMPR